MRKLIVISLIILALISCTENKDIEEIIEAGNETETGTDTTGTGADTGTETYEWEAKDIVYDYEYTDSCSNAINPEFLNGINSLAIKIFKTVYEDNSVDNVIISPLNINIAIGMLYNGGNESVKSQIRSALNLISFSDEDINYNFKLLLDSYWGTDEQIDINLSNSAWFDNKVVINENYEDQLIEYFFADIYSVDLLESLDMMDSWVDFYTNGLIQDITNDLDIDYNTALVLLNTICFNGGWTYKFDAEETKPRAFTNKSGETISTDFMYTRGLDLKYFFSDSLHGVRLPYGRGGLAMYLFIYEDENIDNFCLWFNNEEWSTLSNEFELLQDDYLIYWEGIYLPKFNLDFSVSLPDYLTSWGIPLSDYTELCSTPIVIQDAFHKCVISINEFGTEAAAVTGSVGVWGAPPCIKFNHPFYFMIADDRNGTILFQGIVNELE